MVKKGPYTEFELTGIGRKAHEATRSSRSEACAVILIRQILDPFEIECFEGA
jgi:hypothetical protein